MCLISMAVAQGFRFGLVSSETVANVGADHLSKLMMAVIVLSLLPYVIYVAFSQRYNHLDATLPLLAKNVWLAELVTLLIEGLGVLTAVVGLMLGLDALLAGRSELSWMHAPAGPYRIFGSLAAWLVMVITLVGSIRPAQNRLVETRLEVLISFVLTMAAASGAVFLVVLPTPVGLAMLLFSGLLVWHTYRTFGPTIHYGFAHTSCRPYSESSPTCGWSDAALTASGKNHSIFLMRVVWRALGHRVLIWLLYAVLAYFGFILADGMSAFRASWEARIEMVPLTWYLLVVMLLVGLKKGDLIDALPIARRRVFALLMLPVAICVLTGYAFGHVLAAIHEEPTNEVLYLEQDGRHGLHTNLKYFEIDWRGTPPPARSPSGEELAVHTIPIIQGLPPVLYKPYSTADSIRLRGEGLTLVEDYHPPWPSLAERIFPLFFHTSQGGLFPLLAVIIYAPWLLLTALATGFYRASISHRRRMGSWSALMGVMMATHIVTSGSLMIDLAQPHIFNGFVEILAKDLAATLPGGAITMYVLSTLLIFGCYTFARRRFERIEIPAQKGPLRYTMGDWAVSR